jgi:ribosomal protein S17E
MEFCELFTINFSEKLRNKKSLLKINQKKMKNTICTYVDE